ncbi:uncharacterized protein LOC109804578 [Cajanus cajan]|uniref:uncharacterized protein LOC109804578 n=1 Tax=Cajanus cajan TaxID=3821 RepID=UPI00098DC82C|nr:uncharacterized protein LOC109804578 [Cajanus cajan]
MSSKVILSFLLITLFSSSCVHVGLCQSSLDQILPGINGQGAAILQDAQCMQKLLPCQAYVKNPSNPPESCCEPLKEIHDNQKGCLCNFLKNPTFLQSVRASQEDFLKLPQACGIEINVANCNFTGAPSPAADGEGAVPEEDTAEAKNSHSTKMITTYGFVALLTALIFYAY